MLPDLAPDDIENRNLVLEPLSYPRIAGELQKLGLRVSPSTVRRLLLGAGLEPAPRAFRPELAGLPPPASREHDRL